MTSFSLCWDGQVLVITPFETALNVLGASQVAQQKPRMNVISRTFGSGK